MPAICYRCRRAHPALAHYRACSRFPRRSSAIYLTGVDTAGARELGRANLGLLAQPGNSVYRNRAAYTAWGADNGFYGLGAKADPTPADEAAAVDTWATWLRSLDPTGCLFATIPDVLRWVTLEDGRRVPIGDAEATLARYAGLVDVARGAGFPAALVAQDGLAFDDDGVHAGAERVAWELIDVIFVGGSDDYKLGDAARELAREARRRGIWVHVGRVNSWQRIALWADDADSMDGTFLGFGPTANLPRLVRWLDGLDAGYRGPARGLPAARAAS